jgi:DNA anti-recombination protein RmuC
MAANKRLSVTEETRKELHELKEPCQTYDQLLQEMAQQRRHEELERRFQKLEEVDGDDLTPLSDR